MVGPPPPVPQPQPGPPRPYSRTPQQQPAPPPQPAQQPQQVSSAQGPAATAPPQQNQNRHQQGPNRRNNSVHSAAVSLETVERAIGDLRVSNANAAVVNGGGRGGRRGGRGQHRGGEAPVEIKVPETDFDFAGSNAKFDKAAVAAASSKANSAVNGEEGANGVEHGEPSGDKVSGEVAKDQEKPVAYNPSKSFFDSLSSSAHPSMSAGIENGRGGRVRRGGGSGMSRRDEERERNVATFGEPGGSYGGGWGGYSRRGGRPRRGGARGGGAQNGTSQVVPARGWRWCSFDFIHTPFVWFGEGRRRFFFLRDSEAL